MKKFGKKLNPKYRKREWKDGEWHYTYLEDNKVRIDNFFAPGRHKYFKNEKEKEEFLKRKEGGVVGKFGYGRIKSTDRMKIGTGVFFFKDGEKIQGRILATNGTTSKSPTHFNIIYKNNEGKSVVEEGVQREKVYRRKKSWSQVKVDEKLKTEGRALKNRDVNKQVLDQARNLVMSNWEMFADITSKYYRRRVRGGWDASKFGFEEDDLKQEVFFVIHNAALSYLTNNQKDNRSDFVNYVRSFLKSNLALKLAAGCGGGGHLHASAKDQLYLWFFKDTLSDLKATTGRIPGDMNLVKILNKKRKALPDVKGNRTIRDYKWTLEKIKNKKAQSRKMSDLEKTIEVGGGDADTLLSILNSEEIETFGHYKIDPVFEVEKKIMREELEKAINKVLTTNADKQILIRSYGLFLDENSPAEMRAYATGQTPGEIAKELNKQEAFKMSKMRWTPQMIEEREGNILKFLRRNKEFKRAMGDFIKSEQQEWPEAALVVFWVTMYRIIDEALDEYMMKIQPLIIHKENKDVNTRPDSKIFREESSQKKDMIDEGEELKKVPGIKITRGN